MRLLISNNCISSIHVIETTDDDAIRNMYFNLQTSVGGETGTIVCIPQNRSSPFFSGFQAPLGFPVRPLTTA